MVVVVLEVSQQLVGKQVRYSYDAKLIRLLRVAMGRFVLIRVDLG